MKCYNAECQQDCETGFDCVHEKECDFFIPESEQSASAPVDSPSTGSAIDYLEWALGDDSPIAQTLIHAPSTGSCAPISCLIECRKRLNEIKKPNAKNEGLTAPERSA